MSGGVRARLTFVVYGNGGFPSGSNLTGFSVAGTGFPAPPDHHQRRCRHPVHTPAPIGNVGLQSGQQAEEQGRRQAQSEGGKEQAAQGSQDRGEEGQEEGQAFGQPERLGVEIQLRGEAEVGRWRAESQEGGNVGCLQGEVQLGRKQEEGQRVHGVHEECDAGEWDVN